jgi:hypothetical protein
VTFPNAGAASVHVGNRQTRWWSPKRVMADSATQVEDPRVTPRAWKTLALGAVVIAAAGGYAVSQGRSSSSMKAPAHWGLYSSAKWDAVSASFARRGFARDSVRIVTAARLANGQPFVLLGARSHSGHTCFAVGRGIVLGATICRISKPLMVFSAPDTCAACSPDGPALKTLSILGLVRSGVTATMISQRHEAGLGVVPAGPGFAFNTSAVRSGDRLRARNAAGRVLASITFRSS